MSFGSNFPFFTATRIPFNTWSLCVSRITCTPPAPAAAINSPNILCPLGCMCASGFSSNIISPFLADTKATTTGSTYVIPNPTFTLLYEFVFSLPSIYSYFNSAVLEDIFTLTTGDTPGDIISSQAFT